MENVPAKWAKVPAGFSLETYRREFPGKQKRRPDGGGASAQNQTRARGATLDYRCLT